MSVDGFAPLDDAAPVDIDGLLERIPAQARVRGMTAAAVARRLAEAGHALPDVAPVVERADYPLRDTVRLVAAAARALYPELPVGGGLRRLGAVSYDSVVRSPVGRAIFGLVTLHMPSFVRLVPAGIRATGLLTPARVSELEGDRAVISLERFHALIHHFVGGLEHGFDLAGQELRTRVRRRGVDDYDVELTWKKR